MIRILALTLLVCAPAFCQLDAGTLRGKPPCSAARTKNCVPVADKAGAVTINSTCPGGAPAGSLCAVKLYGDGADITGIPGVSGSTVYRNVKDSGVKGDGVTLTDVATTSGSATISSTARTFVSGDVGKLFACIGAGASVSTTATASSASYSLTVASATGILPGHYVIATGVPYGTYVETISGTTVNLSYPTTGLLIGSAVVFAGSLHTTVSSVSGHSATLATTAEVSLATATCTMATNDQPAIITLLAAVSGSPTTLFFPPGIYGIGAPMPWIPAIKAMGAGAGVSILRYMETTDMSGSMIRGGSVGYHDQEFSSLELDGSYATQATYRVDNKAIDLNDPVVRMKIHDNYIHGFPATCIGADWYTGGIISNNVITDCGRRNSGANGGGAGIGAGVDAGVEYSYTVTGNVLIRNKRFGIFFETQVGAVQSASHIVISGNTVDQTGSLGEGIVDAGILGMVIVGNHVHGLTAGTASAGISVDHGTNNIVGAEGLIEGNSVYGFYNGIAVNYLDLVAGQSSGYRIIGNTVRNAVNAGIWIQGAPNPVVVYDLQLLNNVAHDNGGPGIFVQSSGAHFQNLITNGNTLYNNGLTTATAYLQAGIALNANVAKWICKANTIYDGGSGKQLYGLTSSAGISVTSADIQGNNLENNVTSQYNFSAGTVTGWNYNNLGPSGTGQYLVTAAAPLSNTDAQIVCTDATTRGVKTCGSIAGVGTPVIMPQWAWNNTSAVNFPASSTKYLTTAHVNMAWGASASQDMYVSVSGTVVTADFTWFQSANAAAGDTNTITLSFFDTTAGSELFAWPSLAPTIANCPSGYCHLTASPNVALTAGHFYSIKVVAAGAWASTTPNFSAGTVTLKVSGAN